MECEHKWECIRILTAFGLVIGRLWECKLCGVRRMEDKIPETEWLWNVSTNGCCLRPLSGVASR